VDVISDLHLQACEPGTFEAWRNYMRDTPADALFILGDLFEVWVGDDAAAEPGFAADCAAVLQAAAGLRAVFFMHGNRYFLVGDGFLRGCHATLLPDPTVLGFAGRRWLPRMATRCAWPMPSTCASVRKCALSWQREFRRPLQERRAIARDLREQSEARNARASSIPT
jgi:UDP-2,3-diacylglucosamine hydrolase